MKVERAWQLRKGDLRAAVAARREFTRYLRGKSGQENARYDAALIFGELVANAVKCARAAVSVEVISDGWARLRVIDDGDCFDAAVIAPQPLDAESGRGLYIANALARDLTVNLGPERCEVNATLPVRF